MNDTKWNEVRLAMHELRPRSPKWRTRDLENSHVCDWDGDWYYRFRDGGYDTIEWLDIRVDGPAQRESIHRELARIHVPGEATDYGFRIYGHALEGLAINYIAI